MKTGVELIAIERAEQVDKHGRTIGKDLVHNNKFQLALAASWLVAPDIFENDAFEHCPDGWDEIIWNKMCAKGYHDRLVIAGALIAAEIDRLQNS